MFGKRVCVVLTLLFTASLADSAQINPAIIFDIGGKFDQALNQSMFDGAEKFKADTGINYVEVEITDDEQREQTLRSLGQSGANPIISVGFAQASPLELVAQEFPGTRFILINGVVDLPNVRSILFKEYEASFLVGMLAAFAAEDKPIGFIGGMDIPYTRRFACGYEQGAKHVRHDISVITDMAGKTPTAWSDPKRGGELAQYQFEQGVEVVFAVAGGTGLGVYQQAQASGKLAIGVDSNQNSLHPGTMLSSMLKRIDTATYIGLQDATSDTWLPGIQVIGLAEEGVGWALDEHNATLISDDMKQAVELATEKIAAGALRIHDYMLNNSCDY